LTCTDSSCPETPRAPPNTKPRLNTTTSTDYNATAMAPIDDAIKDLKSRNLREHFTLREVTKKYKVNRLMLGRSSRLITRARAYIIYYKAYRERPSSYKRDN
ncbi:hypothetical protein BU23DRAFT_642134, partial [Bimuria novae-zelandiae CBS 107.79]